MHKGLPEMCYVVIPSTNELVVVKKGMMGYFPQREDVLKYEAESVDLLNEKIGVTKAQAEAMLNGSMFGWDIPASNPDMYDENGLPIKERI